MWASDAGGVADSEWVGRAERRWRHVGSWCGGGRRRGRGRGRRGLLRSLALLPHPYSLLAGNQNCIAGWDRWNSQRCIEDHSLDTSKTHTQ